MVAKERSALRIQSENMYALPNIRGPKIPFHDRKYFLKRKIKRKLQKINNSTSPKYRSRYIANNSRNMANISINSEFKMKRVNGARSKRVKDNNEDDEEDENDQLNNLNNQTNQNNKNPVNIGTFTVLIINPFSNPKYSN